MEGGPDASTLTNPLTNVGKPGAFCPENLIFREKTGWRRGSESNRRCSFCRAVPYHLATPPSVGARQIKGMIASSASRVLKNVESHRKTGLQNPVRDGFPTTREQLHQGSLPNQESLRSSPRSRLTLDGFRSSRLSRHASVDPIAQSQSPPTHPNSTLATRAHLCMLAPCHAAR